MIVDRHFLWHDALPEFVATFFFYCESGICDQYWHFVTHDKSREDQYAFDEHYAAAFKPEEPE